MCIPACSTARLQWDKMFKAYKSGPITVRHPQRTCEAK